jgi:hypothetical protein
MLDLVWISYVRLDSTGNTTNTSDCGERGRSIISRAIYQSNVRTLPGENLSKLGTDPLASTSDEGNSIVEREHY